MHEHQFSRCKVIVEKIGGKGDSPGTGKNLSRKTCQCFYLLERKVKACWGKNKHKRRGQLPGLLASSLDVATKNDQKLLFNGSNLNS